MKQKNKIEQIFNQLKELGFHPIDIKYLNGYFIFEHGKDMVIHFHIKECKGWLFGIWWDLEDKNKFDFFTQYERDIDKFKPSASCFVEEGVLYDKKDLERELEWRIIPILKFIHKHPYVAWAYDGSYPRNCWDYKTGLMAFKEFWEYQFKEWKRENIKKRINRKYLNIVRKICQEYLEEWQIIDENKNGCKCFPRYTIICKGIKNESIKTGFYQLDLKELNKKIFKKVQKFDKKLEKRHLYELDITPFDNILNIWVK